MTVFLYPNLKKDPELKVTQTAVGYLLKRNVRVLLKSDCGTIEGTVSASADEGIPQADAVLSVGGDGTLLRAAKKCVPHKVPILGVNIGRTGFLATCEVDELEEKIDLLLKGQYSLDLRSMLHGSANELSRLALNDIVIYNAQRQQAMDFSIYCDGSLVSSFRGDGVIVATPTGSTAYSLSAGGPILDSHIAGFVVNAICSHSLKNPPIVFSADRKITVRVDSRDEQKALVSFDGGSLHPLEQGQEVSVQLAPLPVKLISFTPAEQFEAIDKKLIGRR